MLFRRLLRIKSMQFLYAQYISNIDHNVVEITNSIDRLRYLYISLIKLILTIRNKAIKELSISDFFKKNNVLKLLINNINNNIYKFNNINDNLFRISEYDILLLLSEFRNTSLYKEYINTTKSSFIKDKNFIIKYYECYIMHNNKLYSYEDNINDLNYAHLMVYNTLKNVNPKYVLLYNINSNNINFIINLYRKTLSNKLLFNTLISDVLTNWDLKRIAKLDLIVMHMAICEFLYFPNIPIKVTMNEYIEIIKIYSTTKSPIFINGILDKILKILQKQIIKIGKGLL